MSVVRSPTDVIDALEHVMKGVRTDEGADADGWFADIGTSSVAPDAAHADDPPVEDEVTVMVRLADRDRR